MARILLIDDDYDILRIGSRLLLDMNHDVVTFDNGTEALEYLQKYSFDIVITDANMPHLSGFDVVKRIKSNPNWRHISVALLTARKSKDDVEKGVFMGVDDYMVKPIDPLMFIDKVKAMLEKNAPREWPEVVIDPREEEAKAYIQNDILIERVSELGIVASSPVKFNDGDIIKINGILFESIRVDVPHLKVVNVRPSQTNQGYFVTKTVYLGAKDNFLQKIRSWMNKRFLKKAA